MFTSVLLAGGLLLGQADAPGEDELALEVRKLVSRLNAPRLAEREEAEQKLLDLGPEVLERLPLVTDRTPAEVTQRIERIRQKLRTALAKSVLEPSRVTLQGDAVPLSEILAAIQEQTGNQVVDDRGRAGGQAADELTLKVAFDGMPFWQAMDRVLDQIGLCIDPYGTGESLRLCTRCSDLLPLAGRTTYSGPFRFEAVRVDAARDLRNPNAHSLRLTLEVAWEPRLAPISLQLKMADVRAVDERGNPLPVDGRQAEPEALVHPDANAVQLIIPLGLPPRSSTAIGRLGGRFTAMVPGKIQTFRFTDLEKAKNAEQRMAGVAVLLEQVVRETNTIWQVRMRMRLDEAGDALASHRTWVYDNEAYLEGPDGEPVLCDGYESTRQTENEVGVAYAFAIDGPLSDYAFVYKTPGMILSQQFDFEVRDVQLP
jgi:hypothetical protein